MAVEYHPAEQTTEEAERNLNRVFDELFEEVLAEQGGSFEGTVEHVDKGELTGRNN